MGIKPAVNVDLAAHFVSVSQMASKRFSRLLKILAGAVADAEEIFLLEGRLERFVHFWALVTRQFIRYRCFVRASALSFSTLLALIPLLAVALSVTSRFLNPQQEAGLTGFVEKMVSSVAPAVNVATNPAPASLNPGRLATNNAGIENNFAVVELDTNALASGSVSNPPPAAQSAVITDPRKQVAEKIHELVQTASNGTLGATGLIFFIITAISLLRGIEETFNDMWGVTRGRSWRSQFTLYWSIISLGPLLLAAGLGFTGSAHWHAHQILESSPFLAPLYAHVLPIAFLSLTLGFIYKLTPNTKVELSAAMLGGLVSGATWHLYNQLGFLLVSRTLNASKLYGSLVLVVLVMGGLYILWLIILFGAQVAYAFQNRTAYLQDRLAENVNQRGREFVALRIMTCLGQRFLNGMCPATVPQISMELGVPSRLTQSVLRTLATTRLVTEVTGTEAAFVPARPLDAINTFDILMAMRTGTGQELPVSDAPELAGIYGEFARIEQAERNAASGISLLVLASRASFSDAALAEPKMIEVLKISGPMPAAGVPKASEPELVEPPPPAPVPEKIETLKPVMEKEPPRRETVRPDENTDFPL